jgi:cytochrome c553|tara:strand:+ start:186 stop:524 length:339 start_codon:yes stop_codon:yes gene_type:complete
MSNIISSFILVSLLALSNSLVSGDKVAGEARYKQTCINCHGPAGMGVASYPKISGKEVSYVTAMLETYRDGIEVGPNSSLMIMMAMPLTDVEIANLAAYLEDARYQQPKTNQ